MREYDAIIIGGGFYGCCLALHLRSHMRNVIVVEREKRLLDRASYRNQARLHNGYHYPRSFRTAARSRSNVSVFMDAFADCVVKDFTTVYCIARHKSKVNSRHFERVCRYIGAPIRRAPQKICDLFCQRLIKDVFEVEEYAFDCDILRDRLWHLLHEAGIDVRTQVGVQRVESRHHGEIMAALSDGEQLSANWLLNCTYSGLFHIPGIGRRSAQTLKHQIAEIALFEPPQCLSDLAITVMDGPFFSFMPFPSRGLHSLSHVRYTHHCSWADNGKTNNSPHKILADYGKESNYRFMVDDAARFLPALREATYIESLFETKTLLPKSDVDDSRPILVEVDEQSPRLISILGSKLDNIFDVFEHIDRQMGIN